MTTMMTDTEIKRIQGLTGDLIVRRAARLQEVSMPTRELIGHSVDVQTEIMLRNVGALAETLHAMKAERAALVDRIAALEARLAQ